MNSSLILTHPSTQPAPYADWMQDDMQDGPLTLRCFAADTHSQLVYRDVPGQGLDHCKIIKCLRALLQAFLAVYAHFP